MAQQGRHLRCMRSTYVWSEASHMVPKPSTSSPNIAGSGPKIKQKTPFCLQGLVFAVNSARVFWRERKKRKWVGVSAEHICKWACEFIRDFIIRQDLPLEETLRVSETPVTSVRGDFISAGSRRPACQLVHSWHLENVVVCICTMKSHSYSLDTH